MKNTELTTSNQLPMERMADAFYASGLFPDIKSQAQAIVKIQAGAELDFPPIYSMQKIYIVQGKIVIAAEAMGALIKKSGRYDYTVTDYTDLKVTLSFTDKGKQVFVSAFTMDDARKAGLVKPGSGWEKFPRAMLMSKALSQGARIVCPDVIGGVYTFEDFGLETTDDGDLKEPPKVIIEKPSANDQGTAFNDMTSATPAETPTVIKEPPKPTAKAKRDPETITSASQLINACNADFGLQPKQVYAELNIPNIAGLTVKPSEAYRQIASVR